MIVIQISDADNVFGSTADVRVNCQRQTSRTLVDLLTSGAGIQPNIPASVEPLSSIKMDSFSECLNV